MTTNHRKSTKNQKGASLIFTLVALLVLLSAAAISINAVRTQQSTAGNLALRQELIQHSEWVIAKIIEEKDQLPNPSSLVDLSQNYSPHITPTNNQGIPLALLVSESSFRSTYGSKQHPGPIGKNIKFRHFIERMCQPGEPDESLNPTGCITTGNTVSSASDNHPNTLAILPNIIYRISLRVDGPKNTQVFIQSTFTRDINT